MKRFQPPVLDHGELFALFDQLFPRGFAGADVIAEIAPEGWERSPLVACFHPSAEQVFRERLERYRNMVRFGMIGRPGAPLAPRPAPTLDEVRRECPPFPVNETEEVNELVVACVFDLFVDRHEVIVADGRVADLGPYAAASVLLDEYITPYPERWIDDDGQPPYYVGTIWISGRADLTPVYSMIFRRLQAIGADWVYHFPDASLEHVEPSDDADDGDAKSSLLPGVAGIEARLRRREIERQRAALRAVNDRAREAALDEPPPATVRAYREVYGCDPRGWPPA